MSASILPAHQRQQQQGNISESDEDAPDNRPSNYVAPTISTPLPDSISLRAWRDRPANSPTYVPYWTDPAWDPRLEISGSGRQERERFGDVKALSRPAILPEDEARFPTPYARYGIPEPYPTLMKSMTDGKYKSIRYTSRCAAKPVCGVFTDDTNVRHFLAPASSLF